MGKTVEMFVYRSSVLFGFEFGRSVMCSVVGYIRSIGVDADGGDSIWFQLVRSPAGNDWVSIGEHRAWFTVRVDATSRKSDMHQLIKAMQSAQPMYVKHTQLVTTNWVHPGDSFMVDKFCIMQ